jgi:hypothetical protein
MPPVKIRFFLDLEENFSFLNRKQKEIFCKKGFLRAKDISPQKAFFYNVSRQFPLINEVFF